MKPLRASVVIAAAVLLWGGCTSAPRYTKRTTTATVDQRAETVTGRMVVQKAQAYLGAPYRYGGSTRSGVDCSGLVFTVFKQFGIALPRTSYGQSSFGVPISKSSLAPGDLVFFHTGHGSKVTHVGIYSGRGEFIHASTRSRRVKYDRLDNKYFRTRYVTARRVL